MPTTSYYRLASKHSSMQQLCSIAACSISKNWYGHNSGFSPGTHPCFVHMPLCMQLKCLAWLQLAVSLTWLLCADDNTEGEEEIDEEASDLGDQEAAACESHGCQVCGLGALQCCDRGHPYTFNAAITSAAMLHADVVSDMLRMLGSWTGCHQGSTLGHPPSGSFCAH